MTKRFRPWNPKQKWLLPPEITEFIPEGHPAHFVRDLVVEQLDLTAILDTYVEDRGFPPLFEETDCGACFWSDQAGHGLPSIPDEGFDQGTGRMGVRLYGPQPSETDQGFGLRANRAARSQFSAG